MSDKEANILLVEDDYLDIMNVERELSKINVTMPLSVARNGREALNMLRGTEGAAKITTATSVILLDINMPRMNGLEFLAEMRREPEFSHIPVFIMTTSNDDIDRTAAQRLNVAGYIVKPLTFDSFEKSHSSLDSFSLFLDLIKLKQ